jgi:hypothetical protein
MSTRKKISISKLASYASSPHDFCSLRGGVKNKKAVKVGLEEHSLAGKSVSFTRVLFSIILVMAGVYFFWTN